MVLNLLGLLILRLKPTCKGRHITSLFPLPQAYGQFYSTATESVRITSHALEDERKEIDFNFLFQSCTKVHNVRALHALLVVAGRPKMFFSRLVNLYAYFGAISRAQRIFNHCQERDVYTWNSMVSAYCRNGRFHEAVNCFYQFFYTSGLRPDFYTFPPVLKACRYLLDGRKIHGSILKLGYEWDVFVAASLIHMYSRFGFIGAAKDVFDSMQVRDGGSWNAMISGYCLNGNAAEALEVVDQMRIEGTNLDAVTVASILSICAQLDDGLSGMLLHLYAIKSGLESQLFVSNALINMYAKFGSLKHAKRVFDQMVKRDIVSWNSIIAAYEQNNDPMTALAFFDQMQRVGIQPDVLTIVSLSSIASQVNDPRNSRCIHGLIMRKGWFMEEVIVGNAVVDMYAKMGAIDTASAVFKALPIKDVISWNTLITGYAQNGLATKAIEMYRMMEACSDISPNQGTWVSILPAYSHVGALREGMRTHGRLIRNGLYLNVYVGTCLVDMYGRCGKIDDALQLFYEVPRRNSIPWNAIISCLSVHGHGDKALMLFREMLAERVKPDHVTFVSLLSACSHAGLVSEGQWCFRIMQEEYAIKPTLKHYGCMVDLFGRAGYLEMANKLINSMPLQPDASMWGALLAACRVHGNTELGRYALNRLLELDSENVGYYVLLSNIYANIGKWEGVDEVRSSARDKGLRKTPGWSSIEVNNKVDVFYTGNRTHPQGEEIYKELRDLTAKIKTLGYVPDFSFVLQDVEDDEKENILMGHSERLAIAYGIISTPPKTPIRIFKNLRICGDCHNATKFMSELTEREIIVRDSNRFHQFKNGICSCGDYW